MDKTIIKNYGNYLSKVNPEKGRRRAQEQEAKWAEERKKREEEKLTEAYQRELRERAEQAARERRKVEKATAAFNAEQAQKGTVSNTPDRRELRNRYNTRQNIAAHATGDMGVARPQDDIVAQMDSYINAGKLSKEQLKQAKELLKQEQKRSTDVIRQGNTDLMIPGTDEYNRYQKWLQLEAKTRGGATRGALLPFLKAGNAVTKGIEKVTNSQNSPIAKEINRQFDSAFRQDDLAAEQSPFAHGAGNLAGSAAMYSATSPMFDAAAEGLGVSSTLGKILVNQAAQNAQDVALDTLPEVQRMRDRGMSDDEIRRATAKNVLGNMAGNAVMQGLSDAVIPALRNAFDKTPRIDMDEFRQGIAKLQGINDNTLKEAAQTGNIRELNRLASQTIPSVRQGEVDIPQFKRLETASNTTDIVNSNTTKQIEDAVQRQTAEAQKVLKEAEPIEEWTRKQLSSTGRETAKDIKVLAQEAALRNKDESTYKAIDNLVKKSDDLDNAITSGADASEIRKIYSDVKKAYNTLNGKLKAVGDNSLEAKKSTYFGKNSEFNVDDILKRKPADSDDFSELFDDTVPADNVNPTNVGDSAPTNNYTSSVEKAIDGYREALSWYDNKDIHPTSRKSIDRLKTALDKVAESAKAGDNAKFRENYDEFRKALTRVNENMAEKDGVDYFRDAFKGDINPKSEQNLMKLYDDAMYQKGLDDLDIDENGFIIPKENEDLPFNEIEYDKYGRVMLDDEGIPKRRRGVDVGSSIRNMDARFDDDVLTSEQKLSRVRGNTLERAGIDNEQELADIIPEEDFTYWTQPEKTTYAAAENRLATDWQGSLEKYTKDYTEKSASDIRSAEDVDAMMLMRNRLNDMARNATDPAEKRQLYAQSRKVALNLRKAGTEAGRNVQAFAKWTRTPEGAITSAQGFAEDLVDKALKKEPKLHNEIEDVSRQIESWLDDMDTAALTREEIEKMIREALLQRKRLRSKVSDGDIRKIADSIMNERQYADIQKEFEFLSTGFEDIDADTLERVQDIFEQAQGLNFNSKERVDLENEAYKLLAMKISPKGGSFRDKLDAWRYLAMLANPTTHIKNITGNILFGQGMVSVKNSLAALIEAGADRVSKLARKGGIDRTKSILTPADKGLLDASAKDGLENAYRELAGNKYTSTGTAIDNAIPAFNTKTVGGRIINKAADINSGALNREDELAVMAKYRTSLAGFLKANGADESIFNATDAESKNLLESARAYAMNQAKEAAFHQDAPLMQRFSKFTGDLRNGTTGEKIAGLALDTVIPFKKTPANILKSAFAYSPAELLKVISDIPKLNKGTIKAADFIDDISKTATGSVALGIGALLAHEGIIKIGSSKTKEEKAFDTQTNRQNVAVKVGNKYIGLSELIPAAAPIILGGTIYESWKDSKGEENALNTIFSGMGAIAEGVTDMTMLSGIADTLNSIKYSDSDAAMWQKLLLNEGGNLASQLLPTLGRKINVTADDTKRSTYSDQTGAWKTVDQNAKYLQTKIPGLQQAGEAMKRSNIPVLQAVGNRLALQPNIDVKGQVQDSPGVFGENGLAGRIANNFLSPVSLTEDSSTAYDDERRRLANATGETKVLPYIASSEAKIEGVGQLSPEQWTQYRQQRGQMREGLAMALIDDESYKEMSDPDKAELLKGIDTFTKAYTQAEYGKEMSSTNQKLADVYDEGGEDALVRRMWQSRELNNAGLNATDNMIEFLDNGGNVDDYLKFKDKVTTINDKGKPTIRKDDFMKAVSELPKEQQELYFNTKDISLTKAEQAAYDQGGPSAAVQAWQTKQRQDEKKAREKEKKLKQAAREAGVSPRALDRLQGELASYGATDSPTTVYYYNHARAVYPNMSTKAYTNKLRQYGGEDMKITKKELTAAANKEHWSQAEMEQNFRAFGEWKKIPKLVNGTWK